VGNRKTVLGPEGVDLTLRKVSQLRSLVKRLPHLPTPFEQERCREFETLVQSIASGRDVAEPTLATLRVGFRLCWLAERYNDIILVGDRFAAALNRDRDLGTYHECARRRLRDGR
jgi:hypothetical protein